MDLLININSLHRPITGIGRYTAEILRCLLKNNDIQAFDTLDIYTSQQLEEKLRHLDDLSETRLRTEETSSWPRTILKKSLYARQLKQYIQQRLLRRSLQQYKNSIYWESNYILQPFDGQSVASIHDLSYIKYPQYHSIETRRWLDENLENTIFKADALLTLSEFSKQEIMQQFSVPENKIKIVAPAVAEEYKTTISAGAAKKLRHKYQLPEKYILSVCTLEPRKNLKTLIQAYSQLPKKLKQNYPLVLVGSKGWGNTESTIQRMVESNEIILLGYIAQQDIPDIYKAATLFVYISLYEGYGMPVAEALASGTAVITSKKSAMSEISTAAKLVNPLDEQEVIAAMQEYLEDGLVRKQAADKGRLQMKESKWQHSADILTQVLTDIELTK